MDETQVLTQLAHHSASVTKHERSDLSSHSEFDSLPCLPPHSTFHSLISHFPLQSFSPLFGPIIFVCALLLPLSLCSSPFIYAIISHLHSVSFLFMLLSRLVHMLPISLKCILSAFPACLFPPSPRATALGPLFVSQKPECQPTDKPQLRLIINIVVEAAVQVGDPARTGRKRGKRSQGHVIIKGRLKKKKKAV